MRAYPLLNVQLPSSGVLAFGNQRSATHIHRGVDLPRPEGTPVYAAGDGVAEHASAEWEAGFSGYGRHVVIKHAHAWTLYAHLQSVDVTVGARVLAGDMIARVGKTAFTKDNHGAMLPPSSGPHLHFEVALTRYPQPSESDRIDPRVWLSSAVDARTSAAITAASRATGVDLALLRALACASSHCDPAWTGPRPIGAGLALGLFALPVDVSLALGVRSPLNPEENARAAATLLKTLLLRFPAIEAAIAAWVWDASSVEHAPHAWPEAVDAFVAEVVSQYAIEQGEAIGARPLVVQREAVSR